MGNKKIVSKEKIILAAEVMIMDSDTGQIDMRGLARHLGIAVGTLYNYYSSREALLEGVFYYSWEKTFDKIKTEMTRCDELNEGMRNIFNILDADIKNRKQLGKKMILMSIKKDKDIPAFEVVTYELMNLVNQFVEKVSEDVQMKEKIQSRTKWVFTMFFSSTLLTDFLDQQDKNELIEFYLRD